MIDLIIKIGGAPVSEKTEDFSIDSKTIRNISEEIAEVKKLNPKLILVTGVGGAGHGPVLKHQLHKGRTGNVSQDLGMVEAQLSVNNLRNAILDQLWKVGIPSLQLYASSIYISEKMRIIDRYLGSLKAWIDLGFVPVISGDMVPDTQMGYSVLSGDQILFDLASKLDCKRVIFGTDVDGVFDKDPKEAKDARLLESIGVSELTGLIESLTGADASRGMRGKLTEIMKALTSGTVEEVAILNLKTPGKLTGYISGKTEGFTIIKKT